MNRIFQEYRIQVFEKGKFLQICIVSSSVTLSSPVTFQPITPGISPYAGLSFFYHPISGCIFELVNLSD